MAGKTGAGLGTTYSDLEELIPGRLLLFLYADGRSPNWSCRIYTGNRRYLWRSLKTTDKEQAKVKAFDLWAEVAHQVKEGVVAEPADLDREINRWIDLQEKRFKAGEIGRTLFKGKRSTFDLYVRQYAAWKGWKRLAVIPLDGWSEYRFWRKEHGWRLLSTREGANRSKTPPKDSTINREITLIGEWYRAYLVPKGLAAGVPSIKKTKVTRDELNANPPFSADDWMRITRRLKKWAEDPKAREPEWRQVVRHFVLISANVGWRPDSEGLEMRWNQVGNKSRQVVFGQTSKIEHIAELQIWDNKNKRWREGNFLAGEYFLRLRDFYKQWHKAHPNWHQPTSKDLVFCNPKTGRRLAYTSVSGAFKKVLLSLGMDHYTFYSCRSHYVNERLREGVDIYLITKQTGHSLEVCRRHYERLAVSTRSDEATKRTYGKKKGLVAEPIVSEER
jgi:hypothetical protein